MSEVERHQFAVLDGLRGVAALAVMAYHRRLWFGGTALLGHAYLAVDFFFLLSGFIIAHAYDARLSRPGGGVAFLRDRVVRLHPMLLFGAVLAAGIAMLEHVAVKTEMSGDWPALLLAHAVPFPAIWSRADAAFPWNIAIWSLFWELVVNILYVAVFRFLSLRVLVLVVALSVGSMFVIAWYHAGFQVGFARDPRQLLLGFPRVCAAFFLGVLIRRTVPLRADRAWTAAGAASGVLLAASFGALALGGFAVELYDPLVAYILYPPLLVLASRARAPGARACLFMGAVSYPLYILHEPALRLLGGVLRLIGATDGSPSSIEAVARMAAVVSLAYLVLRFYDEPVRRLLRRRVAPRS